VRNTVEPFYGYDYVAYVNSSAIRQKLNVGNHYFTETDDVYQHLQVTSLLLIILHYSVRYPTIHQRVHPRVVRELVSLKIFFLCFFSFNGQ
jgi:hypothetical protein